MVKERINEIVSEALAAIENATNGEQIQELRNKYLSKKSELMSLMSSLGSVSIEERKALGQELNLAKNKITEALNKKQEEIAVRHVESATSKLHSYL